MPDYFGFRMPDARTIPWNTAGVRLRRLSNEGFNWFFVSILLFASAAILLRLYYANAQTVERAIQQEILATVGTPQEPSDNTPELGLVAAALVTINGHRPAKPPVSLPCAAEDTTCQLITRLETHFANAVKSALEDQAALPAVEVPEYPVPNVTRPELGTSVMCRPAALSVADDTSFLIPVQMRGAQSASLWERIRLASALSQSLSPAIAAVRGEFGTTPAFRQLVQAYFISPDSLLRIWTSHPSNVCDAFDQFRLWASKSYFTYMWSHPDEDSHTTKVYIDYGGNGLVQTRCKAIEAPRADNSFRHGQLVGILCTDLKLADSYVAQLRHNLFFATALITYDASSEVPLLDVNISDPLVDGHPVDTESSDTDKAIALQESVLDTQEVRSRVSDKLRHTDLRDLGRGPTRVPYRDNYAFLIPIGSAPPGACGNEKDANCKQAVFFHPRNPTLPRRWKWVGTTGYVLFGAAVAIGIIGIRARPRSAELRNRLTLLRNLQVGVVQVDPNNFILEANDRAEELFGRRLPKYQAVRRRRLPGLTRGRAGDRSKNAAKISFDDLIERYVTTDVSDGGDLRYVETSEGEISKLRSSGRASAYFAMRREPSRPAAAPGRRWLRVAATPMMLAHPDRVNGARLASIFATITEVPECMATTLDSIGASAPVEPAELSSGARQ